MNAKAIALNWLSAYSPREENRWGLITWAAAHKDCTGKRRRLFTMMGRAIRVFAIAVAGVISLPASAALVSVCGPNICYEYDNNPGINAGIALFGAPTLVGDSMRFTPTTFFAQSDDGVGFHSAGNVDFITATFNFSRVYSTSNLPIGVVQVFDRGDYQIDVGDKVQAALWVLGASNINGLLMPDTDTQNFIATAPAPGGTPWALTGQIDPAAAFASQVGGLASDARDIFLQVQNNLTAITNANGELAFIQKKFVLEVATIVPVPAAVWLFGSAMGLMVVFRRRQARSGT